MTYGILASESCLLTDIADSLLEPSQKSNVVDRLSSHLEQGVSDVSWNNYRNLIKHWVPATELFSRRKGKVKLPLFYRGKNHNAYLSHVKVQITASKKDIYLVLVYGITEHPMMLVTNQNISSKEDVIKVAKLYFSRWRIEFLYHHSHGLSCTDFNESRNQ